MVDWDKAVESGHWIEYGIRISGIPHAIIETRRPRVDDVSEPAPPDDHDTRDALWIDAGASVSIELDRRKGIATASRLTFSLDSDRLGELEAELFGAPTRKALLVGFVDDDSSDPASGLGGAEMPFRRGDLDEWPDEGHFHLGLEYVEYASRLLDWPTGEFLRGLTRGVAGRVHLHSSLGLHDGHVYATDRPQAWTGRMVTVYEHLISPGGHALSEVWCEVGQGCRELWVGYVDALPLPSVTGWTFGAHALVRRLAIPFGRPARGKVPFADPRQGGGYQRVWITPADVVTVTFTRPAETDLVYTLPSMIADGVQGLYQWGFAVADTLAALIAAGDVPANLLDASAPVAVQWGTRSATILLIEGSSPESDAVVQLVASTAWWEPGTYPMIYQEGRGWSCTVPYRAQLDQFGVEVELDVDTAAEDVPDIPAAGAVRLQQGDRSELVSYRDASFADWSGTGRYAGAIYLTERDLARTGVRVDLLDGGNEVVVTFLVGSVGTVKDAFLRLATSSGMGINGDYDTLPRQHGLYIPHDRIDAASFQAYPLDRDQVALVAEERVSLADLVGGWCALHGYCIGQRRQRDGFVRIVLERTTPAPGEIVDVDMVLQDGHELANPAAPPNEVVVQRGLRGGDARDEIVRDRPRIVIEGAERWEFEAPGIRLADAVDAAADFLRVQEGSQAVGLSHALQHELQAGDPIDLRTAHPLVWSARLATRSPASVLGRVLAWTRDMGRAQAKSLAMLEGIAQAPAYLCPASRIVDVTDAVVTLEDGAGEFYVAGEKVLAYTVDESVADQVRTIASISGDALTLTVALTDGAALEAVGRLTYPAQDDESERQAAYTYHDGSEWR